MSSAGARLARTPDVDDIARIQVAAWRAAALLPEQALDALDADDLSLVWAGAILNPPTPGHQLLVAVDGVPGEVVGYAAIGPCADPDADAVTGELLALEIDPALTRAGHGSRLMAAAADHARAAGISTWVTWCPLADEARRAFLQSSGWGPDSAYRDIQVGWAGAGDGADDEPIVVREVRMVTDLSADA
jgi:GNAT superfamily N-acetyltransferase